MVSDFLLGSSVVVENCGFPSSLARLQTFDRRFRNFILFFQQFCEKKIEGKKNPV